MLTGVADLLIRESTGVLPKRSSETVRNHRNAVRNAPEWVSAMLRNLHQIKVLYWQRSGFCLWLKRLEEERFKWPVHLAPMTRETARPPVVELDEDQFLWLLDGLDLKHLKPHRALEYRSVL